MPHRLPLLLPLLALAACGQQAGRLAVPPGSTRAVCVNPAGGSAWTIPIDEGRGRADGQPARIDLDRIAWRNPADTGEYELKRASGELVVSRPSSTGGWIMTFRCTAAR